MPASVAVTNDAAHAIAAESTKDLRILPRIFQDLLNSEEIAETEDEAEPTRCSNEIDDRQEISRTI